MFSNIFKGLSSKKENTDIKDINSAKVKKDDLIQFSEKLLFDARGEIDLGKSMSMPIAELSTLGAGVSSLIPAFRKVTSTMSFDMNGIYRVANAGSDATLKMAKDGTFWGALKTTEGNSKMAKFAKVDSVNTVTESVSAFNPATIMMAAALFSIEQKLGDIEEMQKQILQNMEFEKEANIEADVETLMSIITKYKYNWDNETFMNSNYTLVSDIQRAARAHMNSYQKEVNAVLDGKSLFVVQAQVKAKLNNLLKKFKYYRLALYSFSLASLLEIMIGGNFSEEYISSIKQDIEKCTKAYVDAYEKCSEYLSKKTNTSVETNVMKGVGATSKYVGKVIGSIPIIEKGPVDEFLQDSGNRIKENAIGIEQKTLDLFSQICNPGTEAFTSKMGDMIKIYNHTSEICFDRNNIYLVNEAI